MIENFHPRKKNSIDFSDFTLSHYRELLRLARRNWPIVRYENIPWGERFLLWRHDCDYSLNRAKALAEIEKEEGVRATYFVNPHCEFYNLLERSQIDILHEIQDMGHEVGLHFDGMFYTTHDESELVKQLQIEASLLDLTLGVRPTVFSFHNPSAFHLSCEKKSYADMLNCYSQRFKKYVGYVSDSNGYWRYRRLRDVLLCSEESCLQVLTHPGWWHDEPMTSRQRVFRAVYGRADAIISFFDRAIEAGGRDNPSGPCKEFTFLRAINHPDYKLLDQLFNRKEYSLLILTLWRINELQTRRLIIVYIHHKLEVSPDEISTFLDQQMLNVCSWQLLDFLSARLDMELLTGINDSYRDWSKVIDHLMRGTETESSLNLEEGCLFLCQRIEFLAKWGMSSPIKYNGLVGPAFTDTTISNIFPTHSIKKKERNIAVDKHSPINSWAEFKSEIIIFFEYISNR